MLCGGYDKQLEEKCYPLEGPSLAGNSETGVAVVGQYSSFRAPAFLTCP